MPLRMETQDNGNVRLEFENVVSIWNLLKYLSNTVYLKQFVVEKYEGGNTLVPEEAWKEEGILYTRLPDQSFHFPYESIGFVLNDSVSSLTLYMLENQKDVKDYKSDFEMRFEVTNTDSATLEMPKDRLISFTSLYLLSLLKVGFDSSVLKSVDQVIKTLLNQRVVSIEFVPSTLLFGLNGMHFVIRVDEIQNGKPESKFFRIECRKKCRKVQLSEKQVVSFGYLKKKILSRNKILPYVYYGLIVVVWALLFFLNKKLFIGAVVLIIAGYIAWRLLKKHILKLYRHAPGDDKETPENSKPQA